MIVPLTEALLSLVGDSEARVASRARRALQRMLPLIQSEARVDMHAQDLLGRTIHLLYGMGAQQ